jgi:hypothetical protein
MDKQESCAELESRKSISRGVHCALRRTQEKLTKKEATIRRSLQRGYDERGVLEPDEKFWSAVKQILIWLQKKSKARKSK